MELKEFFAIFIVHKKIFWSIILFFVICGSVSFFLQNQTYKTSLTLNVTRDIASKNAEYSYDSFYRLQADERFADTIVRWIESPYIVKSVFGNINKKISAKRLSSQVVDVSFITKTKKDGKYVSTKLIKILNQESQKLNIQQKQDNWFIILGSEPVIDNNNKSFLFLFAISTFLGFFTAFWVVMIRHYMID